MKAIIKPGLTDFENYEIVRKLNTIMSSVAGGEEWLDDNGYPLTAENVADLIDDLNEDGFDPRYRQMIVDEYVDLLNICEGNINHLKAWGVLANSVMNVSQKIKTYNSDRRKLRKAINKIKNAEVQS